MTLIVATIHADHITMVSDSRVTFSDREGRPIEAWNRDTYFRALPKIVRLRADLIVGVAGDDPHDVIERLLAYRDASVARVLDHLETEADAEFVVAALGPARLWEVKGGNAQDRTESPRRGWAGDLEAYDKFRESIGAPGMEDIVVCEQLEMGMRTLTSFALVKTVGGVLLEATSGSGEFRFRPYFMRVMPPHMKVESVTGQGNRIRATFVVPEGADATTFQTIVVPGDEPDRGAVAFLIPETGKGLVFSQYRPWKAERVPARSVQELATAAFELGIRLTVPEPPAGHW